MKINLEKTWKIDRYFSDLKPGDLFIFDNIPMTICMKIPSGQGLINYIVLATGALGYVINPARKVTLLEQVEPLKLKEVL